MIYPQMTTGRAYEYDVYEKFRDDLIDIAKVFPDVLVSHYASKCANINYNNVMYKIVMKIFNVGEKPWYEINAYMPIKFSTNVDSLRYEYWNRVSDDMIHEYEMHPITINKKRLYSINCSHHKTLNSFDEIKVDVQIWMTEINKKILKARIEAI